ncbi:hypothetical protein [Halosimplex salinum]|uniref:hypothetical protein n=1 Tax=Halosimplex salinum TaxID=1710538 RepID=UPI000F47E41E|nr:hypothetical protein [Halosimplex salinum]
MNRRTVLASASGLVVAGFAGCLADSADAGSPTHDSSDTADTDTTTDRNRTDRSTEAPTPPHDAPFPPDRDDVDRVVWFREVSDPDSSLLLEHAASSVALPDAENAFTLRNGTDRTFRTNFYDWALYRWEGGEWHRVAPQGVPEPLMRLAPGESHTWTLALGNDDVEEPTLRSQGTESIAVDPVGGGHYAFAAEGWWREQDQTPTYEHKTVCAARFELEGPPLDLVPSAAVTGTRREGDTVVVSADNPRRDGGDDGGTEATYVLTRDDDASDARALITEQACREWPLRDALAHADPDVREVRVETTTRVVPIFGVRSDENPAIAYDGRTYRITAEER